VRDSDGTLIIAVGGARASSPGVAATERAAIELGRAVVRVDADEGSDARERVRDLLSRLPARCALNVAGPRQSEAPDAYARALRMLQALLG
jgi:hypothetical protein